MAVQHFECGDFLLFQVSKCYARWLEQIFAEIVNITQKNIENIVIERIFQFLHPTGAAEENARY